MNCYAPQGSASQIIGRSPASSSFVGYRTEGIGGSRPLAPWYCARCVRCGDWGRIARLVESSLPLDFIARGAPRLLARYRLHISLWRLNPLPWSLSGIWLGLSGCCGCSSPVGPLRLSRSCARLSGAPLRTLLSSLSLRSAEWFSGAGARPLLGRKAPSRWARSPPPRFLSACAQICAPPAPLSSIATLAVRLPARSRHFAGGFALPRPPLFWRYAPTIKRRKIAQNNILGAPRPLN